MFLLVEMVIIQIIIIFVQFVMFHVKHVLEPLLLIVFYVQMDTLINLEHAKLLVIISFILLVKIELVMLAQIIVQIVQVELIVLVVIHKLPYTNLNVSVNALQHLSHFLIYANHVQKIVRNVKILKITVLHVFQVSFSKLALILMAIKFKLV